MKEFNELLKELGITRKDFAKQIGLTYNSIGAMLVEGKPVPRWAISALLVAKKFKEPTTYQKLSKATEQCRDLGKSLDGLSVKEV